MEQGLIIYKKLSSVIFSSIHKNMFYYLYAGFISLLKIEISESLVTNIFYRYIFLNLVYNGTIHGKIDIAKLISLSTNSK